MVFDQVGLFGGSVDIPSEPEAKSSLLASGEQTIVGEDLMEGTSKGNSFPETGSGCREGEFCWHSHEHIPRV